MNTFAEVIEQNVTLRAEIKWLAARLAYVEAERDAAVLMRKGLSTLLDANDRRLAELEKFIRDNALNRGVPASVVDAALRAVDSAPAAAPTRYSPTHCRW